MSEDSPLNNGQSHHSEQQFMKISDYSEGKQSDQNQSQAEENPFDDLQNILGQQQNKSSRNEMILAQKCNELQQKCIKLTNTNAFLTKRIQQLEISIREDLESQIDIDYVDQFCTSVMQQIEKYKLELKTYREKQMTVIEKKNKEIQQSNQYIQNQKIEIEEILYERAELIQMNSELQKNNRNLLNQIESLQRQLQEERNSKNYTKRSNSRNTTSAFQQEIQAQLQNLIEKLMTELQFERNSNKKSKNQIKRMQQEIMELERQLVSKNNKIYQQQMEYLRSNRGSPKSYKSKYLDQNSSSDRFNYNHNDKPDNVKSKSDRNTYSALKSFTIQQMLSGVIEVDEKQRYIIASKLISFYLKKMEIKDYTPYNSDKLMISNFNKINPILISIRKMPSSPYSGEMSIKKLGWNLGVILSSLIIDQHQENGNQNQNDDFMADTIQRLLKEQLSSLDEIYNLKSVVDDIIKSFQ